MVHIYKVTRCNMQDLCLLQRGSKLFKTQLGGKQNRLITIFRVCLPY